MHVYTTYRGCIDWDYDPEHAGELRNEVEDFIGKQCDALGVEYDLFLGNACCSPYVELSSEGLCDLEYVGERIESYLQQRKGVRLL